MSDNRAPRVKAMIHSVIVFLVAPVVTSAVLVVGVLYMAAYTGPDLRQFDPQTEMELRIFGVAVLGLVGFCWIGAPCGKQPARKESDHAWGARAFFVRLAIASIALFVLVYFGFLDS